MQSYVPLSELLTSERAESHPVSAYEETLKRWSDFRRDVGVLLRRLREIEGEDWLIVSDDAYAMAVALLATLHAGRRALLPSNLQPGHLAEICAASNRLLVDTRTAGTAPAGGVPILETGAAEAETTFAALDADACGILLHTSGSTGRPEAVVKPLRCLEAEVGVLEGLFARPQIESVLSTVPPFHIYGLLFRVLWPLCSGRVFAASAISFPADLIAAAERSPGSLLVSSPAFLKRALSVLELGRLDGLLQGIFSSGGPLPAAVASAYNSGLRHKVVEVYGSTETGGIGYRSVETAEEATPWKPLPGVAVSRSAENAALVVASPFLATSDSVTTGDYGDVLPNGDFVLSGRGDQIIKLEERRVSLFEIQKRLESCEEVTECRVIALEVPGERTVLGAAVVPSEQGWRRIEQAGKRAVSTSLQGSLRQHLEGLTIPRKWRFIRHIPETAQGKTKAGDLLSLFEPNSGRQVLPEITGREERDGHLRMTLSLPQSIFYFDGHFTDMAILPGVAQVDWAIKYAVQTFDITGAFFRIEALKFFKVLIAESEAVLELDYEPAKQRLAFRFFCGEVEHSSGRIVFGARQ